MVAGGGQGARLLAGLFISAYAYVCGVRERCCTAWGAPCITQRHAKVRVVPNMLCAVCM